MKPTENQFDTSRFNSSSSDFNIFPKYFFKMKNLLMAFLCVFASFSSFSQLKNEYKIEAAYGQEWLDLMKTENQELLILLDKYAEYGFFVKKVSPRKYEEFTPILTIPIRSKDSVEITIEQFMLESESGDFNPLRYNYFPQQDFQVYKLDGVDAIIYILPQNVILSK